MRLFQRRGIWYAGFARGVERSLRTRDQREAERLFRALKRKQIEGKLRLLDEGARITLEAYRVEYIAARKDLDPDTLRMDSLALRQLAAVIGGNIPLKLITERRIAEFRDAMLASGLSPVSLNTYLRHLRAALNDAADMKYIGKPPRIKGAKVGRELPSIMSPTEIDTLLARALDTDPEMRRIISFALWTGCRREEILFLHWQDVSEESARIRGKGKKVRMVPLLAGAIEAMGEPKDIGPVFRQWHKDTVSHRFKVLARACGLNAHFHNLRHSAATQMLRSGIPLPVVQKILGHVDIRTTQIYAQVVDEMVVQEMQKFRW